MGLLASDLGYLYRYFLWSPCMSTINYQHKYFLLEDACLLFVMLMFCCNYFEFIMFLLQVVKHSKTTYYVFLLMFPGTFSFRRLEIVVAVTHDEYRWNYLDQVCGLTRKNY